MAAIPAAPVVVAGTLVVAVAQELLGKVTPVVQQLQMGMIQPVAAAALVALVAIHLQILGVTEARAVIVQLRAQLLLMRVAAGVVVAGPRAVIARAEMAV